MSSEKKQEIRKKLQENSNSNKIKWGHIYIINKIKRMSEKKKILIKILKQLEWHRNLAQWFLVIVKKTENEKIVDDLLKTIEIWMKSIKNKRIRTKLVKRVKELQKKWDTDQEKNNNEANNMLEKFINNIEG